MRGLDLIWGIVRSAVVVFLVTAFFATPGFAAAAAADKADKEALIDCVKKVFDSLEVDDQKNVVYPGYKVVWYVRAMKDTNVKIEFVKKTESCEATSPFATPSFSIDVKKDYGFEKLDSGKVKDESKEKCYSYKITCTPKEGEKVVIDPMIDVPKP